MSEDDASFLTVVLESSSMFWEHLQLCGDLDAHAFIEQILVFVRAYTLLNDANQLAVFAVSGSGSTLLHATPGCAPYASQGATAAVGGSAVFAGVAGADVADAVLQRLRQALRIEAGGAGGGQQESVLSSSLSRALCFINKYQKAAEEGQQRPRARVLCLTACPDAPAQYIAAMNAIFAAQRSEVVIDACKLGEEHSSFLQQAAYLTGGVYLRPPRPSALTQYLLTAYASDIASRQRLRLPRPTAVDFRASCFCHKRPTDLGFVCSVCLSIFCELVPACTTCGTNYAPGADAGAQGPP